MDKSIGYDLIYAFSIDTLEHEDASDT